MKLLSLGELGTLTTDVVDDLGLLNMLQDDEDKTMCI
jgi:hypothetical protein